MSGGNAGYSGQDLDIWGDGLATNAARMPDPDSGRQDCVRKTAGRCPAGCSECEAFRRDKEAH